MSKACVIGIGSPYGDDSLGWQAVDALEASGIRARYPANWLSLRRLDRPGPLLLEAMAGEDLVLLIDAMYSGARPGTVKRLAAEELELMDGAVSTHGFDLATTLELGRRLAQLPDTLIIVGIEMGAVPEREITHRTVTETLALARPRLGQLVESALRQYLEKHTAALQA